ncbi:MAG: hypothetical protein IJA32_14395 [Lachnospiraceae bacterium]|nr:hypothetical protein [Lachnospiraceae bacterium]
MNQTVWEVAGLLSCYYFSAVDAAAILEAEWAADVMTDAILPSLLS